MNGKEEIGILKDLLTELAKIKALGPVLSFSEFNLFCAFQVMSEKTTSRSELAVKLNVGDGAVRTILSRLVKAGLVTISRSGCTLTAEGFQVWQRFENIFPKRIEFFKTELTPSKFNYAFLVRGSSDKIGSGMEQRDAAIAAGATQALIVIFKEGNLRINSVCTSIENAFPNAGSLILRELKPQEDDAIVIAGADTAFKAMRGAFAASWLLT